MTKLHARRHWPPSSSLESVRKIFGWFQPTSKFVFVCQKALTFHSALQGVVFFGWVQRESETFTCVTLLYTARGIHVYTIVILNIGKIKHHFHIENDQTNDIAHILLFLHKIRQFCVQENLIVHLHNNHTSCFLHFIVEIVMKSTTPGSIFTVHSQSFHCTFNGGISMSIDSC